jgi:hypothetical protein
MKTTKHFALAALLALGATIYASAAARAETYDLTPTGAEPGAAGQFALSGFQLVSRSWGAGDYYYAER